MEAELMSLSQLVGHEFSRAVKSKGRSYFFSARVKITAVGRDFARATVRGTERYVVDLDLDADCLHVACTCPFTDSFGEPCKHIWATILKVESEGGLQDAAARRSLAVELDLDDEGYDYRGDDDYDHERPWRVAPPRRQRTPLARTRQRAPSWQQQLEGVRRASTEPTATRAGREILYVVDVAGSLARGGLTLELMARDRKKNGEWTKPKVHSVSAEQATTLPDMDDRHVLSALFGASRSDQYGYDPNGYGANRFTLNSPLMEELLPAMAATGRLLARATADRGDLHALTWEEGAPWVFTLEVARADSGKQYVLTGSLRRRDDRQSLSKATLLVPGAVFWPDRVARLDDQGAFPWILLLRQRGPLFIPLRDKEKLLNELLNLPALPRMELPEEMQFEEVRLAPRPRLVVKPSTNGWGRDRLEGVLSFVYGEQTVQAFPRQRGAYDSATRRLVLRDLAAEQTAEEQLGEAGLRRRPAHGTHEDDFELKPQQLSKIVRHLVEAGWLVEADGSLYRKPGEFKIKVESGIDWFDIDAAVDFEGQRVALPALLAALRKGENTVRLDDGSFGMLPEEWLKKYGLLARMGTIEDDKLRFRRAQVGLIDALLADQSAVSLDKAFEQARDELRRFDGIEPADPPKGFVGELRHYQCDGLGWLQFLERFGFGGCLADDMGLGKTVQVLALLAGRRTHKSKERPPSLVVVPRSLIFNWKQEAARFAPQLRVVDHTGLGRAKSTDVFDDFDLILTTYGTLRRDVRLFKEMTFDYCILDESQAIKNSDSESAKAVRLLRGNHRLALSGTPVENHLGELWSLFEYLNPGMLGHASVFQLGAGQRNPDADTRALLARALRPFILRRTKQQVAPELPAKTEQTLYCDLETDQRKLYDELREHYRQSLLGKLDNDGLRRSKIQVLEALLRLRQAACHPGLIDKGRTAEASAKLDMLLPQLREVLGEDHKALVFSQFTSMLAIIRARLDEEGIPYEYLDGRTRDRAARVERFQSDADCKLFLVSLKAGGVGLNLTAAEYVYLLDPWWNPAVEAQAIDRTHRIGQDRPVFAYRLIARDTVEEKVLELQKTKRALADAIIGADNSLIRDLKREDLELLLS
jgi:superfamily II DNA or RNA helicase